jgi:hypothetical protein
MQQDQDYSANVRRLALARTCKAPQPRPGAAPLHGERRQRSGQPGVEGNPDLRPELAWDLDTALESCFARDAMASVPVYAAQADHACPCIPLSSDHKRHI